jgi:thymidylate kinase
VASTGVELATSGREELWLPLLQQLTDACPAWTVWKDPEPAFAGAEDIDAAAPRAAWPEITRVFRRWASQRSMPLVVCTHIPETLNLFAVCGDELLQLEVRARGMFRGAVHFAAQDLRDVSVMDARGFRVLRPGARGLLRLTLDGLRRGGQPNWSAIREHRVVETLAQDLEGAELMAAHLGPAAASAARAARAAAEGGWDRNALVQLEAAAALRAPLRPHLPVSQTWFREVRRPRCPVLQTVYAHGRMLQEPTERWLDRARDTGHRTLPRRDAATAGRLVALVGPDGVGKSTVARALLDAHPHEHGYVYFRPPLRGPLDTGPPVGPRPRGEKHPPPEPRVLGWLRLAKNLGWFHLGHRLTVRPALRRGALVVTERWAYGYVGQPGPLRYFGPEWLARLSVRWFPRPDLVVNLAAPPGTVVARKDELTYEQVEDELERWAALPVPSLLTVDATPAPADIVAEVHRALQASRPAVGPLQDRRYLAFPPHTGFLALPRASRVAALAGMALYEPVDLPQRVATAGTALLLRVRLDRVLPDHPGTGIDWTWWDSWFDHVGRPLLGETVHVTIRSWGEGRRACALFTDARGRPRAFVKRYAEGLSPLSRDVRERLDARLGRHVRTPRTLRSGAWEDCDYDVFEAMPPGRHRRPPAQPQRVHLAIDEIRAALADLPRPAEAAEHHVVCHTGFTPRNLRVTRDGDWWVVDWDNVRWGPRLVYELRYWAAEHAYRWRPHPEREAPEVLRTLRTRGTDAEILEAIRWPGHVGTYRSVEGSIYREVERLLSPGT